MVDRAPKVPRAQVSGAFSLAVTGNFCGECPVFWSGSCRDAKISTLGGVFPKSRDVPCAFRSFMGAIVRLPHLISCSDGNSSLSLAVGRHRHVAHASGRLSVLRGDPASQPSQAVRLPHLISCSTQPNSR